MTFAILYILTASLFLGLDMIGLRLIVAPVFERQIGHLMLDSPRIGPAAVFYLFFVGAAVWLVSWPAVSDGALLRVALNAAILGAAAYGTYEFTNLATLKDWSWAQVWTDLIWGTCLTGFSVTAGLWITRQITG